ncbi:hypothetical protein BAX97_04235 [Elizabethkingia meningoseptica]|uniref:hypothetical protein n=1 Tax=Elizabethkingia meningoseptica TaxID=238 RepID=UPI000332C37B|nr:hypothetical protein [Elizabethkingia meningoseptica]AQX06803.1 hypothetical protein BBD33_16730 [Elizabethkingia meningoseptica]AQX48850.1 hypothetical protein B5G46_16720 [Elizabethkingia meningoseptica]EJK5330418.1 hypothetical protein [Elizabethkingia meningoseptica]EOR28470.1 hypothetical protein L100_16200 [Elizabethkingia meningoseptica ATCC 13253 = NBRC 12535]KUY14936.1 hypothetical protein ATB99_10545 [Elizabethkingia meningoseptica]
MNIQIPENLKAHFLRLYQMAICDDNFSSLELKMLYRFAEERGITSKNLDEILMNPVDTKNALPHTLEDKVDYLYDLVLMIWADHQVDDNERSALEKYIKLFGFVEENAPAIADYLLEAVKNGKTKSDILYELQN